MELKLHDQTAVQNTYHSTSHLKLRSTSNKELKEAQDRDPPIARVQRYLSLGRQLTKKDRGDESAEVKL